jgi:integrase
VQAGALLLQPMRGAGEDKPGCPHRAWTTFVLRRYGELMAVNEVDVELDEELVKRARQGIGSRRHGQRSDRRRRRRVAGFAAMREAQDAAGLPQDEADALGADQSWRRRSYNRARHAAGAPAATPYALRHSFASLLLHEGRSVIYVARQLGHDARLTLSRYGHVIDELEDRHASTPSDGASRDRTGDLLLANLP